MKGKLTALSSGERNTVFYSTSARKGHQPQKIQFVHLQPSEELGLIQLQES